MNERIKKLAKEADAWCVERFNPGDDFNAMRDEKFAELIVRECIAVIEKNEDYRPEITEIVDEYTTGVQVGLASAIHDIEHHFGVE